MNATQTWRERLEWAVRTLKAVPTDGPILTLNGIVPLYGPRYGTAAAWEAVNGTDCRWLNPYTR